jgi:hypothetical protein
LGDSDSAFKQIGKIVVTFIVFFCNRTIKFVYICYKINNIKIVENLKINYRVKENDRAFDGIKKEYDL